MSKLHPRTKAESGPHAITPSIWWIGRGGWGFLPALSNGIDCNIYLLKGRDFDVLIDAGGGPSLSALSGNIRLAGSEPSRIREIWLTHAHGDHFIGAGLWAKKYPRTVCRLSELSIDFFRRRNYRLVGSFFPPRPSNLHLPAKMLPLKEGSVLSCAPFRFKVEETPGHVPDALVFRGKVDGIDVLFSGDTLIGDQVMGKIGLVPGMLGWVDSYWLSNVRDYRQSIARLGQISQDLILPGHGSPLAGATATRSMKNCLRRLDRLIAAPQFLNFGPYFPFPN